VKGLIAGRSGQALIICPSLSVGFAVIWRQQATLEEGRQHASPLPLAETPGMMYTLDMCQYAMSVMTTHHGPGGAVSSPGRWACIRLTVRMPIPALFTSMSMPPRPSSDQLDRIRVLIAEDNPCPARTGLSAWRDSGTAVK
jgi:hypothetical protein